MDSIDALANTSLYFNAAQQAAAEAKRKEKTASAVRPSFRKILSRDAERIAGEEGIPPEAAGLSVEDTVVFLKDAADAAGDELTAKMTSESFSKYRAAIKQFMNYVIKNSFEIEKHPRRGFNRRGKPMDPAVQVQIINQKLDTLASDLLYNHMDKLKILEKVGEIKGLLVDLQAA